MSSPKAPKTSNPAKNLSESQLRRVWQELKPLLLLERLRAVQPSARWTASGSRLSACCPFHDDGSPSFHIYLDRGYAKCFGCDKWFTNPLEMWSKLRAISLSDALGELKQAFGLKFLSATANSQLMAWERHQLMKRRIAAICHDELINAISSPNDPKYLAAQAGVRYLIDVRQIPVETIPALPMLGLMPPLARLLDTLSVEAEQENIRREAEARERVERFVKFTSLEEEARVYMQAAAGWVGTLVFRLDVAPDIIGRFKLRRPNSHDMIFISDVFEEALGFYGLGWAMYKPLLGAQQKFVPGVYVVEGEFDALSVMARQVQAGGPNFVIVSVGGASGTQHIDGLRHFGFDEVYLVGDEPTVKNGDVLIQKWLPEVKHLRAKVYIGHTQFPGCGDPDEMVVKHGLPAFQTSLLDLKNRKNFTTPQEWAFDKAQPEVEAVDESDLRYRMEVAAKWGQLLKNTVECDAFTEFCNKAFGLPPALLKREIVAREEDEPAFIMRVASVLSQIFYVIGQRALDNDRRLFLWHKEHRKIVQIALADDASVERELGAVLGTNYQFFQEKVGLPTFLEKSDIEKEKGKYLQKQDQDFRWYLRQALILMAQGSPDYDTSRKMGQGIHVVRDEQGGPPTLYLVNGRDVYHGTYEPSGSLTWKTLEGPAHNNIIFDVGIRHEEAPWMSWVKSASDLTRAKDLDPAALWTKLYGLINAGWRFKNHPTTCEFLTSHLMAATVCSAFRRQVLVAFHADTRAGKSKMLMGLIAGTDFARIHVIAAAAGMPGFTAAGIRQTFNNKVRPLCLDEFEDDGTHEKKSRTITEVFEMFRSLVGENNSMTHGSRGGEPVTYRLNFFVFIAAINKARKVQDANRMITVYMERLDNRLDPVQLLTQEFGGTFIEELKKDLAIALLPHIARMQEVYAEIETEYGKAGAKPVTVDSRIFEGLYPTITILKTLGMNYQQFVTDFCEANKEALTVSAGHTDSQALFDWICQSPKLKMRVGDRHDRNDASLLQLLATPETRGDINFSGSGLYYDEVSQILLVNWTTAIQTVLSGHARYGKETNVINLRELANRAPHALKPEELDGSGALGRLRTAGLVGVPVTHLTGYRITHIMKGLTDTRPEVETKPVVEVSKKKVEDDGDFGG